MPSLPLMTSRDQVPTYHTGAIKLYAFFLCLDHTGLPVLHDVPPRVFLLFHGAFAREHKNPWSWKEVHDQLAYSVLSDEVAMVASLHLVFALSNSLAQASRQQVSWHVCHSIGHQSARVDDFRVQISWESLYLLSQFFGFKVCIGWPTPDEQVAHTLELFKSLAAKAHCWSIYAWGAKESAANFSIDFVEFKVYKKW